MIVPPNPSVNLDATESFLVAVSSFFKILRTGFSSNKWPHLKLALSFHSSNFFMGKASVSRENEGKNNKRTTG